MGRQNWVSLLAPNPPTTAGEQHEFTTMAAVSPGKEVAGQVAVMPASYVEVGTILRVTAAGRFNATAEPTFKVALCWGATSVKLLESEAIAVPSAATGSWRWRSETIFTATGTSGSASSSGELMGLHIKSSTTVSTHTVLMPESATEANNGVQVTAVETGVAKTVFLAVECGTSNASNKFYCHMFLPEVLN